MEEYVGVYDKEIKKFHFAKVNKAIADEFGLSLTLVKAARETTIEDDRYIIGGGSFVKSRRGGVRKGNLLTDNKNDKTW